MGSSKNSMASDPVYWDIGVADPTSIWCAQRTGREMAPHRLGFIRALDEVVCFDGSGPVES